MIINVFITSLDQILIIKKIIGFQLFEKLQILFYKFKIQVKKKIILFYNNFLIYLTEIAIIKDILHYRLK